MDDDAYEERARSLLTAAADTIPVRSGPVALPPRRPVWPWLVAAAAAVLVVVLLPALLLPAGETPPDPAPDPSPSGTVTVPQTVWMTEDQATRTLEERGLRAVVDARPPRTGGGCGSPDGRVLRSRPAPTRTVDAGTSVRVWIPAPAPDGSSAACLARPGFQTVLALLDLARFGTTDLAFAPEVTVVTGGTARTLTAAEAGDPAAWGSPSPLTELVSWLDDVRRFDGRPVSPTIVTYVDPRGSFSCGPAGPPELSADRRSVVVRVDHLNDGVDLCRSLRIYSDDSGRIDAVVSEESSTHGELFDGDWGTGGPSAAEPAAEQQAVADDFAAYARGGGPPAFAPEVRLLLGNAPVTTVSAAQAADPATWQLDCESYGEASCPVDALLPLREGEPFATTSTVVRELDACHQVDGALPADLAAAEALARSMSLSAPEPENCALSWEVQLWLDDEGRISAANFVAGQP